MLNDEEVTLLNLALIFIGSGVITFIYYLPWTINKKINELHNEYINAKKNGVTPTIEMQEAVVYVNTRKFCLLLIAVGLLLLAIHYIF